MHGNRCNATIDIDKIKKKRKRYGQKSDKIKLLDQVLN